MKTSLAVYLQLVLLASCMGKTEDEQFRSSITAMLQEVKSHCEDLSPKFYVIKTISGVSRTITLRLPVCKTCGAPPDPEVCIDPSYDIKPHLECCMKYCQNDNAFER